MSQHSVFAFSASPRWIPCPASMAYPENTAEGKGGSIYADEGTAAHELAALVLRDRSHVITAHSHLGQKLTVNGHTFEVTEEFAGHVQTYVDDVRCRSLGGYLLTEQQVTLEGTEGFDETNYGTSDAIIAVPAGRYGVIEDLKFGQGEKVYAWTRATDASLFIMDRWNPETDEVESAEPNYQLMLYALAARKDIEMFGDITGVWIVINQPRVSILSELWVPVAVLDRFALFAAEAYEKAVLAMGLGVAGLKSEMYKAGEKQCRWCQATTDCPALKKKLQADVGADFDKIGDEPIAVPVNTKQLAKAMAVVPMLRDWIKAVEARANGLVAGGTEIIGPDKKPYKFVEGQLGDRKWADPKVAEGLLAAQLGPEKMYVKRILTAPEAAKLLDKKATKNTWDDIFAPAVKRAPGKPILVMGSDPRPPYSPVADKSEFEESE